tara:strand:+ start:4782 stop:5975 length:1194 start_codon:yes stop_codon:yes gene_type:complete
MKPTLEFIKETQSLRKDYRNIARIFSYGRPAESENETYYVERYVKNPHLIKLGMTEDNFVYRGKKGGNLFVKIGKDPKVLFSCHTDTVDTRNIDWYNGRKKEIILDINDMRIKKKDTSTACLGADDGTGIWLCWELIKAGVEGLYIFHRAEEVGGIGSSYIANNNSEELEKYDFAVAFDRKDNFSIITQQVGQVCASQEFVDSLSEQLGMNHRADPTGSFTDTANYTDFISECTNLSVGYFNAHSGREEQDLVYVREFRDALIKVDWSKVKAERSLGVSLPPKPKSQPSRYTSNAGMGNNYDWWRDAYPSSYSKQVPSKKSKEKISEINKKSFFEGYNKYEIKYIEYMVDNYPTFTPTNNQIESVEMVNINEPFSVDEKLIYSDWEYFFGIDQLSYE